MKILHLKWKNFMSYGNKFYELDFQDQHSLSLICGQSGAGKSTLAHIICFALYGKVQNKKISDLPNRLNQNLEVEIDIECSGKFIKIYRALNPEKFKVDMKDNSDISDKAGKKNIQQYLEDEIYQIPYHIFNNIISLSINDFKSFIRMTPKDKREIIDKIFGLSLVNKMSELLKLELKETKEIENSNNIKIRSLNDQIDQTKNHLEKLTNEIKENNEERIKEISEALVKIDSFEIKLQKSIRNYRKDENNYIGSIEELTKERQKYKTLLSKIEDKIELYKNSQCPECGSDLHTQEHTQIFEQYQQRYETYQTKSTELLTNITQIKTKVSEIQDKRYETESKLNKIVTNKRILIFEKTNLEKPEVNNDEQTSTLTNIINESESKLEIIKTEQDKISKEINFLKIVEETLGEKGLKQLAIQTIIPNLNIAINVLLKNLNLDYKLFFDNEFEAHISHYGVEINIGTLSTGEQKRLDFAVLVSILKMLKMKYADLNLLIIDEIFASVDTVVVYEIVKILDDISGMLDLNIMIINHAPIDNAAFTHLIRIDKNSGFSNLIKEKID